jgi:hypothetical protein
MDLTDLHRFKSARHLCHLRHLRAKRFVPHPRIIMEELYLCRKFAE